MSGKRIPTETWENVDWSQTPTQIARTLGVAVNTVTRQRARRMPELVRQYVDWPDDLGKVPDVDIAERLGVTRQAVQWARRNRGIPAPAAVPVGRERVLAALVRHVLCVPEVGDRDVLWRFLRKRGGA